jgi:hypothetical protein
MKNYKHAYWVNGNGEPCYTVFTEPHDELIVAISSNNAIILDETHDFVKKSDQNLNFLSAYVFDFDNKTISVNIEVAKKIVLGFIRNRRNVVLKDLDTEQLKCITNQTKLSKIENIKQQLRDLPDQVLSSMSNCSDLSDLNHILPPILVSYKEMI